MRKDKFRIKKPGMRVFKTFLAILICVLVDYFRGAINPFQSGVAALICLQPTVASTFESSKARVIGTVISGLFTGALLALLRYLGIDFQSLTFYLIIAFSSLILMSIFVQIDKPKSLSIGIVVFLVIAFTNSQREPISYTLVRVIDTFVGIAAAFVVNWLPFLNLNSPQVIKDEIKIGDHLVIKNDSLVQKLNHSLHREDHPLDSDEKHK